MAESTLQAVNVAMRGGGYYSAVTKGAKDVIDGATPLVLDAIRCLPDRDTSAPFTLTDMGCADGGTSLDMVRQAITQCTTAGASGRSASSTRTSRGTITTACSA